MQANNVTTITAPPPASHLDTRDSVEAATQLLTDWYASGGGDPNGFHINASLILAREYLRNREAARCRGVCRKLGGERQ